MTRAKAASSAKAGALPFDQVQFTAPARLTRQHFALYRGYLDGVSEAQLHASYGETASDVRSTRRLIAVLRDTLSVLARRAHDTEAAHLLRLRPGSIPLFDSQPTAAAPSLDEFRERIDPDGVYNESELLALYEEAYPPGASPTLDRRAARNVRLRRRQAEALARMEASLAQDPQPNHPIDGWFEPAVSARLAAAGLDTIADVISLIETKRHRWYTQVPRLGPKGAQRLVDWLRLHAQALQHTLSPHALVPRRQWASELPRRDFSADGALAVAPLEALRVPPSLDGSNGTNRANASEKCAFNTDLRAIGAWLEARSSSEHTRRAYRREAERLLLWSLLEKHKPLSSLDSGECSEYIETFLADPQPAQRWIARGRVERCLSSWRPFAGPLSDRSRETARSILSAMCEWLVNTRYFAANPFAELARACAPAAFEAAGRTLDKDLWAFVLESTVRDTYSFAEHRDRLALLLAYATGLRRGELADASTDELSVSNLPGMSGPVWRLSIGARTVLLPSAIIDLLKDNLMRRGFSDPLACPASTPILAQTRGGAALSADGVGKLFKRIFSNAANLLEARSPGAGVRLRHASTHWLRHTHSVHSLESGLSLSDVGMGLGHASPATTALYIRDGDAGRLLAFERLLISTSSSRKSSESG